MIRRFTIVAALLSGLAMTTNADEGMWLLDAISRLPLADMKSHGLELTPEQIFSNTNPSLKDAIVLLPGGTGGFISAEGLIVTNHHIAFAGIQELSSVQDDYLKNGFVATSKDKELETSYTAEIVQTITDVTAEVLSAVDDTMKADERERAIRSKRKDIEDKMQDSTKLGCRVMEMYGGVKFYLFISLQLKDVRLVYAPPSAIGVFGGETDNWMWPRHTGDFSLMRAYVGPDGKPAKYAKENVPYKPRHFMPVSTQGTPEDSYAMVMGFPGRTFRYREAAAVQLAQEETLPLTQELYRARIDIIEQWGEKDRSIAIKYATKLRRLANSQKNYVATLAGLRRTDLVNRKKAEESQFAAYVASKPELTKKYGTILSDLKAANDELRTSNRKSVYLSNVGGVEVFGIAGRLGTYFNSLKKDEKGTLREPTDKDRQPVLEALKDQFKDYDAKVDKDLFVAMVLKNAELPADHQVKAISEIYKGKTGNERERIIREYADDLFEDTELTSLAGCEKLLKDDPEDILDDEAVKFFRKYSAEGGPVTAKQQSIQGKLARLRTLYAEALLEWKKNNVSYPDANRSLRFTYGEVAPLAPRDAVIYSTTTTLTGIMEKESATDEEFLVPAKLKELWQKKDFGRYADPKLKDVPVAFISNLDITGGNSGSPVINGKGELIGCAFDGNWDGVVGDYVYEARMNRCISVDSRYMLFVMDKFSGAENILKELVIH